jgi:hypothetical protein
MALYWRFCNGVLGVLGEVSLRRIDIKSILFVC